MTKHPRFSVYDRLYGMVCEFANRKTKAAAMKKVRELCGINDKSYSDADIMRDNGYILLEHHTYVVPRNKTSLSELQRICGVKVIEP